MNFYFFCTGNSKTQDISNHICSLDQSVDMLLFYNDTVCEDARIVIFIQNLSNLHPTLRKKKIQEKKNSCMSGTLRFLY